MEIIIIKLKNEQKKNHEKWTTRIVSIGERATAAIARRLRVEQRNRKGEPKKQNKKKHEWRTKPANLRQNETTERDREKLKYIILMFSCASLSERCCRSHTNPMCALLRDSRRIPGAASVAQSSDTPTIYPFHSCYTEYNNNNHGAYASICVHASVSLFIYYYYYLSVRGQK